MGNQQLSGLTVFFRTFLTHHLALVFLNIQYGVLPDVGISVNVNGLTYEQSLAGIRIKRRDLCLGNPKIPGERVEGIPWMISFRRVKSNLKD
jgi:hypothetical protein